MFLRRKFPDPHRPAAARDVVREVVANLDLLLSTKRGVGHLLPDFGFSQSGHWTHEGLITHVTAELRQNVAAYEPRLQLLDVDGELSPEGRPELVLEARITGAEGVWTIVIDLGTSRVARVNPSE